MYANWLFFIKTHATSSNSHSMDIWELKNVKGKKNNNWKIRVIKQRATI
jgi:hypothetical protein